ncbi:MAG: hypothetical protein R3E86_13725 [Pseudomonadales bacterium]
MNDQHKIEAVVGRAAERGLSHVSFGMFDVHGHFAVKRVAAANLAKAMTEGTNMVAALAMSAAPSGTAMVASSPLADPDLGFNDGVLLMDADSCRDFPLEDDGGGLLLLGEFIDVTGEYCARHQLRRELSRFESLGLGTYGAFELECVALDETLASLGRTSVAALRVRGGLERPYQLVADPQMGDYLRTLVRACEVMEVGIDAQHAEFMHLIETSLRPQRGMRIADNAALYKNVAKYLAQQQGFLVSFMARFSHQHQGCGAHINLSLRRLADDAPAFYDDSAPERLSATARHFVAGLHAHLPELFLLLAPNLNSYKRFSPGLFTPINNSWGIDNKTVAFRVVNHSPATARVEVRIAGADVSAHLGLLAVLLAGRRGIEQRLDAPPPVIGNGWALEDLPGPEFPLQFAAAIDAFERSALAREMLGDTFVDAFVGDRRWQIERYERSVTDWELQMFGDGA